MKQVIPIHGSDHGPGGPDPIDFPASGASLTWAMASASTTAVAKVANAYYEFTFNAMYTNDSAGYQAADVTLGRARFLQINDPGYYILRAWISKESGMFDNTNQTWIEPTFWVAGFGGGIQALQPNLDAEDFIGSYWVANGRVTVGGPSWESLYTEMAFNWDPSIGGTDLKDQNPLKVGLTLAMTGGAASINMAGLVHVMRMCDEGFVDISP